MGAPTSSYATSGIALRVSGALKPHHHDKGDTIGGQVMVYSNIFWFYATFSWQDVLTLNCTTEQVDAGVTLFGRCSVQVSARTLAKLEEVLLAFPQSLQINAGIVPRSYH
jgi:hypothetical protein